MGVTGLWQIVHPCARPIKLETLNRKRLAVDASIWIYQFLKAVRDKEGNALRNSHVVGFFRRICKLLFFGIKPVFVFDGGAPALKRQTISERKKRREGRREDAVRTAGRLLAVQMQRRAEEEEQKRKEEQQRGPQEEEEAVPDESLVYVDEIGMSQKERQQNRKFRKKDAYHLPDLDISLNEMGGANDPRIMSLEELQAYAKQFETGEDINVYDFSKIDYDSPFFMSLPASDRYNILNAARLRSRLRMGHSKEQLDSMFPDRMAFSKFQIQRVSERDELTQRLMHINDGSTAQFNDSGRVAGEKGREYVLVKNDGVEGGWALGVISDEGTKQENAIDVDKPVPTAEPEDNEWEDEDAFEDVPIEGLNRLPKKPKLDSDVADVFAKQRRALYESRQSGSGPRKTKAAPDHDPNPDSLFVTEENAEGGQEAWEDVGVNDSLLENANDGEEHDEDLERAIAMSLRQDEKSQSDEAPVISDVEDDDMLDIFHQTAAPEARPFPQASGRAIASLVNKRALETAPESREVTNFGVPVPKYNDGTYAEESNDEESMDLQAALAASRGRKRKITPPIRTQPTASKPQSNPAAEVAKKAGFSGPLPFEKLDLGSSLLGKKKLQERSEETSGGFQNAEIGEKEEKKPEPLPPWFASDVEEGIERQRVLEKEDREKAREFGKRFEFDKINDGILKKDTREVIDLEAEEESGINDSDVIDLEAEESDNDREIVTDVPMGIVDEPAMEEPSLAIRKDPQTASPSQNNRENLSSGNQHQHRSSPTQSITANIQNTSESGPRNDDDEDDPLEWSESENEEDAFVTTFTTEIENVGEPVQEQLSRSPSAEFEDVTIPDDPESPVVTTKGGQAEDTETIGPGPDDQLFEERSIPEDAEIVDFDEFSDPEDEELFQQLALETEEHARFASTLNNKTQAQNMVDYDKELKQLRNQQKKDRRDADEVTQTMIQECQQLLGLFGLPYVTAPMEAEAQCAELVRLGLVDGIVTDDSDCFLFGGTRIYKNMFNQAKFVECYLTSDLEKEFDLTREKLIQVAHLLGSDYTEGLPGVGPVTALEILGEFQTLQEFKTWWNGVQMNTIPKSEDSAKPFRKKFRRNSTKLFLPPTFPDQRVDVAYLEAEVDADPEPFQWGVPDLDALRSFLMATIGWSEERTDEVLVPVIKDMNRRGDEGTQSNITAFFDGGVGLGTAGVTKTRAQGEAFATRKKVAERSKRMGSALSKMAANAKTRRGGAVVPNEVDAYQNNAALQSPANGTKKRSKKRVSKRRQRSLSVDADDRDQDGSEFEASSKKS